MLYIILIILSIINYYKTSDEIKLIEGGGHYVELCVTKTNSSNFHLFDLHNCTKTSENCSTGEYIRCEVKCGYKMKSVKIRNTLTNISYEAKPNFKLRNTTYVYKQSENIFIDSNSTSLSLLKNQIEILFSQNISCSTIKIINQSIICVLNKIEIQFNDELHTNVTIKYGIGCIPPQIIGIISMKKNNRSGKFYILIVITLIAVILMSLISLSKNKKLKKTYEIYFLKQLNEQQNKFISSQKRAFFEYQKGKNSVNNLGTLTPRHLRSFHEYLNRISNITFKRKTFDDPSDKSQYFECMLLNKFQLIEWVGKIQSICTIREREIIASLLTVYLFKFPLYFLDLMKTMLIQLIFEEKKNSNERLIFTETQSIAELIVTNWLSMCMYENFKTGVEGERLFNLYRAIKCKMNSGLVDDFTKKAKYVLSTDNILTSDLDYEILTILVNVNILLKLEHDSDYPLEIDLKNIRVKILSLDTVSQVKEKIIDQAIMMFAENEKYSFPDEENLLTISSIKSDDFHLYLSHHNVKILLSNFDNTSLTTNINKNYIIANTMMHYNIKSESTLLLTSVEQSMYNPDIFIPKNNRTKIHLLMENENNENDILEIEKDKPKDNSKKLVFKPSVGNENKDAHLILLLATKNNLESHISDLFQCIFNWNSDAKQTKIQIYQNSNLIQINYLFLMLDNIATSISMESYEEVQLWKRNSFIYLFWCKIINNPNFIFSVDMNPTISTSLNVISQVLQLSCSNDLSNCLQEQTIAIQQFSNEIESNYSQWWTSFITSRRFTSENDMEALMQNISEKYQLHQFNGYILNNLKTIGRNLLIK